MRKTTFTLYTLIIIFALSGCKNKPTTTEDVDISDSINAKTGFLEKPFIDNAVTYEVFEEDLSDRKSVV